MCIVLYNAMYNYPSLNIAKIHVFVSCMHVYISNMYSILLTRCERENILIALTYIYHAYFT